MTLTKEQLRKKLEHRITVAAKYPDVEEAQLDADIFKLALSALAGMEAEPVAYIFKHPAGKLFWALTDESNKGQSDVMPVYAAQPAPVSVPDELTREEYKRRFMEDDDFDDTFRGGWNACRDAMLQAGNHTEQHLDMVDHSGDANEKVNSPVIKDGWVACSERIPDETNDPDGGATCYLVLYAEGRQPNGGSNVQVSNVTYLRRWHDGMITHWMPLPAAPQQEVNP
ncbi:DUF551 domain-containing protein [Enterobacter hormaechei]|uniref:DUF551 domain-containing protein n=1 Tax=Enterobacter hormaechei TaxID=158836 RepID=UPI003EB77DCA